jgi:hypothetical protein
MNQKLFTIKDRSLENIDYILSVLISVHTISTSTTTLTMFCKNRNNYKCFGYTLCYS